MPAIPKKQSSSVRPLPSPIQWNYFMGIDPGVNGGIAVVSSDGDLIWSKSIPGTQADIWRTVNGWNTAEPATRACLEWIHPSIQGIKKAHMSKLYGSYRELMMLLTIAEIPYETPMPRKWQQALSIQTRGKTETQNKWKNRLKAKAQQLFPRTHITLNTADAILIAEYCRRLHTGG